MIGQTLGQYRIEAQLGAGGMGVVYRARDTRLNRLVALKVLGGRSLLVSSAREDLLREGRAASALNHPNICTVHEIGEAQGQIFMVMEYIDGAPLSTIVPPDGLPIELTLRYGIQIADALEHAHEGGIVHRDLKSSNVMVTREGRVKVVDFGLAHPLDPAREKTTELYAEPDAHAKMAGTLAYMAPEVLRGQPADAASDIWSLGVLLYEIGTGKLPFHGTTTFELTDEILREPVPPPPARVPPALRAIILRCLAKEPKQRYRRAGEVRAALEAVDSFVGAAPAQLRPAPPRGRPRSLAWVGIGVLVVLLAIAAYWWQLRGGSGAPAGQGGRLTLVESSDRRAFDPSLSPDGKMVAFIGEIAGDKTDATDLFVARVSGGGRVQLTHDDAREEHPRFSPDGERILFARRRASSPVSEICMIPALGGDVTTVVANGAFPVWSPDGARIAFIERDSPDAPLVLATAAADGSDRRVVLRGDGTYPFLRNPAWSPDGAQIAVVRSRGGIAAEIWSAPANGGGAPVRLSVDPLNTFSDDPVFTPDGRALIHASNRGGATNLWLLPIASRQAVRLTTGPGPDESPSVARDGAIAFVNSRWRNALLIHDVKTGATDSVLTHTPFLWAPAFSPDGREVAFSRGEVDGSWHVWVVPVGGGTPRQVTSGPLGEVYPQYLPDGGSILYQTWSAPHRVWRVPREGGPAIAMSPAQGTDDGYGDVSPDGRWLAFARAEGDVEHIYIAPIAGGPERLLTKTAGSVPRWAPDSRSIVFSQDRGYARGVFVIAADGTGERRLTDLGGWPVWWPDGTRVGYRIVAADGNQQILTVPAAGGASTPIAALRFTGANYPFDISRDGRLLATSNAVHVSDEIWLLRPDR